MLRGNRNAPLTPPTKTKKGDMTDKPESPFPARNVAFAVNYRDHTVDQFVASSARQASRSVDSTTNSTNSTTAANTLSNDGAAMAASPPRSELVEKDMNRAKRVAIVEPAAAAKRSSQRDRRPREKAREKNRIRYDMEMVPDARRAPLFLAHHRSQAGHLSHPHKQQRRTLPARRASTGAASTRTDQDASSRTEENPKCHKCNGSEVPAPFEADSSVVWIPTKRCEWEDCLSEMTALCTSAALRRHTASKPFFAPLSRDYIRDRIDIDDPLEGYQIRHKEGGWLQGFIIWTNFTTWTHYFKWDSLHESSNIQEDKSDRVDKDGSLSAELESQPRSGDPLDTGVVFPTIAEISLLGGIGTGEYCLRMALDDIISRGQYKYVVMQATDSSRTFYERFGFVRVGAVCRYGSQDGSSTTESGYRHWTYANERNLQKYGDPSCMMALRLPNNNDSPPPCVQCASKVCKPTVIDQLKAVAVEEKPKIAQLGAPSTPAKRASLTPVYKPSPVTKPSPVYKPSVQKGSVKKAPVRRQQPKSSAKRAAAQAPTRQDQKIDSRYSKFGGDLDKYDKKELLTPPPPGQTLSYAQKQYQSKWLAVPPVSKTSGGRRPPRQRSPLAAVSSKKRKRQEKADKPST